MRSGFPARIRPGGSAGPYLRLPGMCKKASEIHPFPLSSLGGLPLPAEPTGFVALHEAVRPGSSESSFLSGGFRAFLDRLKPNACARSSFMMACDKGSPPFHIIIKLNHKNRNAFRCKGIVLTPDRCRTRPVRSTAHPAAVLPITLALSGDIHSAPSIRTRDCSDNLLPCLLTEDTRGDAFCVGITSERRLDRLVLIALCSTSIA